MKVSIDDTNVAEHASDDPMDHTIEDVPLSNVNENTIDDILVTVLPEMGRKYPLSIY